MPYAFRQARIEDVAEIWEILQGAIQRRAAEGSDQWQDGYPNPEVLRRDIERGYGYVLTLGDEVVGYCALMINDEPAYAGIQGQWLTDGDFLAYHRVAISERHLGQGLAKELLRRIEEHAREKGIPSLKADTNFDNPAMLSLFQKLGYTYCGEVWFRGAPRKAFEKVLIRTGDL